jgi:hypothetical protein
MYLKMGWIDVGSIKFRHCRCRGVCECVNQGALAAFLGCVPRGLVGSLTDELQKLVKLRIGSMTLVAWSYSAKLLIPYR